MKNIVYIIVFFVTSVFSQQNLPKIEIQANKMLALVQYVDEISSARKGILKEHFQKSEFNNDTNKALLKKYNGLHLEENIESFGYPENRKQWRSTFDAFNIIASNSKNLKELKRNSVGLFPLRTHQELFSILEAFLSIYDTIFWKENKSLLETKVQQLRDYADKNDLNKLYQSITKFYNSSWDSDLPLVISVVPFPVKTGFTATPKGNIIISGLPLDMDYYEVYFGVMLHEIAHILYEEQQPEFQFKMDDWFLKSDSNYKTHAYNWINETLATAVGNGWVYEKLKGEIDKGEWYNDYHINTFSKALYPLAKSYLENGKSIDKTFVEKALAIYEKVLANRTYNFDNLLTFNEMMINTEDKGGSYSNDIRNAVFSKFRTRSFGMQTPFACGERLKDFKNSIRTQMVVVVQNNKQELRNLKSEFPFLKDYSANATKNFYVVTKKENGQAFILINAKSKEDFLKVFEAFNPKEEVKIDKVIYY